MDGESFRNPSLSAVMCDGMGWFTPTDTKRVILVFDKVLYLLPKRVVEFEDWDGVRRTMLFSESLKQGSAVEVVHYEPDEAARDLLEKAAANDAADARFASSVATIPKGERRYTWQLTNADGDLGRGDSLALRPSDQVRAHAWTLNKFLLAADGLGCVPITGKRYIHDLLLTKYETARAIFAKLRETDMVPLSTELGSKVQPVAVALTRHFIPDSELEKRSEDEILAYKRDNRSLFAQFTSELIELATSIDALPHTLEFDVAFRELTVTELWRRQSEIKSEFQAAWNAFFRTSVKAGVSGVIGLGIAPLLPLSGLVTAAAAAAAPWIVPNLMDVLSRFRAARSHGLYYLLAFGK